MDGFVAVKARTSPSVREGDLAERKEDDRLRAEKGEAGGEGDDLGLNGERCCDGEVVNTVCRDAALASSLDEERKECEGTSGIVLSDDISVKYIDS